MALRATPTIAICLMFGVAAGIALARPADTPAPVAAEPAESHAAVPTPAPLNTQSTEGNPDSPYLTDGEPEAAVGLSAGENTASATVESVEISIESFDYSATSPVAAGSTITITNLDGAAHTLTAVDGSFDTGLLNQGESATIVAPSTPGTYEFFCELHPSMTGELIVAAT